VIRACRRDTFASGSSESKSTSGKIPPSASQRPIWDSAEFNRNCLPTDLPRSITSLAWGFPVDPEADERFNAGPDFEPAISGWGTFAGDFEPFCPSGSALISRGPPGSGAALDRELGPELGLRGAPHSSQYCPPSRFAALHLSHVIMVFGSLRATPNPR